MRERKEGKDYPVRGIPVGDPEWQRLELEFAKGSGAFGIAGYGSKW